MKIIDAHIHFSKIESFQRTADEITRVEYTKEGLKKEFAQEGVILGIAMGLSEASLGGFPDAEATNPMQLDLESPIPSFVKGCLGINPMRLKGTTKRVELDTIERALQQDGVVGLKIYGGYYPYYVYDDVYQPVYDLAEQYHLPVVLHMGDTFSERGLLKYAHPLTVDELAVSRRAVNFVIAHLGDPWVIDAAEVVSKNYNVFGDLSGLLVGSDETIAEFENNPTFMEHIRRGIVYANHYDKLLFGSDWPLVPIGPYIRFIKKLIPEKHYEQVFYQNALQLFQRFQDAGQIMIDV